LSSWVAFADGTVWVAHANDGLVWKIDPDANAIAARTKLHAWLSDLAVGGGFVWVSVVQDGVVYKLSEDDLSVLRTIQSGLDPERISAGGGGVWVANTAAKSVSVLQQGFGRANAARGADGADDGAVPRRARLDRRGARTASASPDRGARASDLDAEEPDDDGALAQRDDDGRAALVCDLCELARLSGCGRAGGNPPTAGDRGGDAQPLSR